MGAKKAGAAFGCQESRERGNGQGRGVRREDAGAARTAAYERPQDGGFRIDRFIDRFGDQLAIASCSKVVDVVSRVAVAIRVEAGADSSAAHSRSQWLHRSGCCSSRWTC